MVEAQDGEEAIHAMNTGENRLMVDAILCDMRMPKISGVEALAYLRDNFPHVPVVVLTGFPDTELAVSCMRNGVVDYLIKPVDGEQLKIAVGHAMQRRKMAWR